MSKDDPARTAGNYCHILGASQGTQEQHKKLRRHTAVRLCAALTGGPGGEETRLETQLACQTW